MHTPNSFPDALIVIALAALLGWYLFLRHKERQRRTEIIHQERLVAMDKGVPLPELPAEPANSPTDPREMLVHGIAWVAMGLGGMLALGLTSMHIGGVAIWPLPLPLLLLGIGLVLFYVLLRPRSR